MKHKISYKKRFTRLLILLAAIFTLSAPLIISGTASAALFPTNSAKEACAGLDVDNGTAPCDASSNGGVSNLLTLAVNILSFLGGVLCVIVIIVSGIRFITSQGDSNAISTARTAIIYALIGLVLIATAQFLVRFVIGRVDTATSPTPQSAIMQPLA